MYFVKKASLPQLFSKGLVVGAMLAAFVISVPQAQAASLTDAQIQAIIGLLDSFGADADVVANTNAALRGESSSAGAQTSSNSSTDATSTGGNTTSAASGGQATACLILDRMLAVGSSDSSTDGEVTKLQKFLAQHPALYPEKRVNGIFDEATRKAVERFQQARDLLTSDDQGSEGVVGPKTRAALACRTVVKTNPASPAVPVITKPADDSSVAGPTAYVRPIVAITTSPLSFTTARPTILGTANVKALTIGIVSFADGMDGFSYDAAPTPVTDGKWSYTADRSLQNGSWSLIIADPVARVPITSATITVSTDTAFGTYIGYMNGAMFIQTLKISRDDALANCKLNATNNPTKNIRCTWNGEEIYNNNVALPGTSTTGSSSGSGTSYAQSSYSSTGTSTTSSAGSYAQSAYTTSGMPTVTASGATLDLKVNGSDGPIALTEGQPITVTWTSSGFDSCGLYGVWPSIGADYANVPDAGTSGSKQMYAYVADYPNFSMLLRCKETVSGLPNYSYTDDKVVITPATASSAGVWGGLLGQDSLINLAASAALAPLNLLIDELTSLFIYAGIGQ